MHSISTLTEFISRLDKNDERFWVRRIRAIILAEVRTRALNGEAAALAFLTDRAAQELAFDGYAQEMAS